MEATYKTNTKTKTKEGEEEGGTLQVPMRRESLSSAYEAAESDSAPVAVPNEEVEDHTLEADLELGVRSEPILGMATRAAARRGGTANIASDVRITRRFKIMDPHVNLGAKVSDTVAAAREEIRQSGVQVTKPKKEPEWEGPTLPYVPSVDAPLIVLDDDDEVSTGMEVDDAVLDEEEEDQQIETECTGEGEVTEGEEGGDADAESLAPKAPLSPLDLPPPAKKLVKRGRGRPPTTGEFVGIGEVRKRLKEEKEKALEKQLIEEFFKDSLQERFKIPKTKTADKNGRYIDRDDIFVKSERREIMETGEFVGKCIRRVAARSGNLKGTFVKELKIAAEVLWLMHGELDRRMDEQGDITSLKLESVRLNAEAVVMKGRIETLEAVVEALKGAGAAASGAQTLSARPRGPFGVPIPPCAGPGPSSLAGVLESLDPSGREDAPPPHPLPTPPKRPMKRIRRRMVSSSSSDSEGQEGKRSQAQKRPKRRTPANSPKPVTVPTPQPVEGDGGLLAKLEAMLSRKLGSIEARLEEIERKGAERKEKRDYTIPLRRERAEPEVAFLEPTTGAPSRIEETDVGFQTARSVNDPGKGKAKRKRKKKKGKEPKGTVPGADAGRPDKSGPSRGAQQPEMAASVVGSTAWAKVVGRKEKRKGRTEGGGAVSSTPRPPRTQPRSTPGRTPQPKRKEEAKLPRSAGLPAITLTASAGGGFTIAQAMARLHKEVDIVELGIEGVRPRKTATGALMLEVPGVGGHEKVLQLAEKVTAALRDTGVRVQVPYKKAEVRVRDLVDSTEMEEVATAIAKAGACERTQVKVGEIRQIPGASSMGAAWAQVPLAAAKKLAEKGRIRVGWGWARVEVLGARPLQCFKCLEKGHTRANCRSEVDRSSRCYRCGGQGHLASACTERPRCPLCADQGRPSAHRLGAPSCRPGRGPRRAAAAVERTQMTEGQMEVERMETETVVEQEPLPQRAPRTLEGRNSKPSSPPS